MFNRIFSLSFFLLIFVLLANYAQAAPANDNQANAQVISGAAGTIASSNVGATTEPDEPTHNSAGDSGVYGTVWFSWVAPESKPVVMSVPTAVSFDPAMAVYTQQGNPGYVLFTRNNDTNGNKPRVEFEAIAGKTYRIVVGSYFYGNLSGEFALHWAQHNTPTNDNFNNALNVQPAVYTGSVAVTNRAATREAGEPEHFNNNNRSVWFKFTHSRAYDMSVTFDTLDTFDTSNSNVNTDLMVYTGASYENLTPVVKNANFGGTPQSRVTFLAKAGITYRIAVDASDGSGAQGNIILKWRTSKVEYNANFGSIHAASKEVFYDNATDITVFRPSNGTWYYLDSYSNNPFNAFQFGAAGDKPVAADYDGDGRTDFAVVREAGGVKTWYISNSFDNSFRAVQWGSGEDKLVPGDYDFDGRMDIAVWRPSNGFWYILQSSDNQLLARHFGTDGDIPVLGNFPDTNPASDLAVYRPSNGTWYVAKHNTNPAQNFYAYQFGAPGDKPVAADYDNDGETDLAVYRPSNGMWYYIQSRNNSFKTRHWGVGSDIPQPGNYDNNDDDAGADFAVYRPGIAKGIWYILKQDGTEIETSPFGLPTDIPASSLNRIAQ